MDETMTLEEIDERLNSLMHCLVWCGTSCKRHREAIRLKERKVGSERENG